MQGGGHFLAAQNLQMGAYVARDDETDCQRARRGGSHGQEDQKDLGADAVP